MKSGSKPPRRLGTGVLKDQKTKEKLNIEMDKKLELPLAHCSEISPQSFSPR